MNFGDFFEQIHGVRPFPWQEEAARRLVAGEALTAVAAPTAAGKTALIDAAIYAAASGGRRKVAFVIDRRVVVDAAYDRALKIQAALSAGGRPALKTIAAKLGPLQVARLRGGLSEDDDWLLFPERVTVLLSTVDQIGSRLLHRGYGVSPRAAPMHAGFVGHGVLYILDEAHLAQPFAQTLNATREYGADIDLIVVSATLDKTPVQGSLGLSAADRSHPVLQPRLKASKLCRLVDPPATEDEFVVTIMGAALEFAQRGSVTGVVVNRVATARAVHERVVRTGQEAILLTGRVRPYDRDLLLAEYLPRMLTGRDRRKAKPLVVVATQTIEVGADFDFDSLVSEAAPLSSLRQRFGRLDRLGVLGVSYAVIARRPSTRTEKGDADPVYGDGVETAWRYLKTVAVNGEVDFGVEALDSTLAATTPPAEPSRPGPVLLPTHLGLLTQTGINAPELDIAAWLHGVGSTNSDVTLVWRADLAPEAFAEWPDIVRLQPPRPSEQLDLPIYAVRSWLNGLAQADVADIDGAAAPEKSAPGERPRMVLRWRGPDDCTVVPPEEIRAGDVLMVPSDYGGCDRYGWHPANREPVTDIADWCAVEAPRGRAIRLVPALVDWLGSDKTAVLDAVAELVAAQQDIDPEIGVDLERIAVATAELLKLLRALRHPLITKLGKRFVIDRHPHGLVLRGKTLDDIDGFLSAGRQVPLDQHMQGVAGKAREIAGVGADADAVVNAAAVHDAGKAEPRFQVMLYGDPVAASSGVLLAKSGIGRRKDVQAAQMAAKVPRGFRHELASLAYEPVTDPLIRHLIATHHGFGRPWFPTCADADAPGVQIGELDGTWLGQFAELRQGLGYWKLAYLELLVRAADIRRSIDEQENA